jgi:hypothetical protein
MITSKDKKPIPMHPSWPARKRGLELVPLYKRDSKWELAYFEAKTAMHQPCYQEQCSCHFPPGFDLTTGKIR